MSAPRSRQPPRGSTQPTRGATPLDMFAVMFPNTAAQITRIEQKVDTLMAAVQIQQEQLDDYAAQIQESADLIADELAKLVASAENPLTDADVTALQAAVDSLKTLEPPHPEQV